MNPRHALHLAGKLHHRRTVAAFGFHKATGAQFGEHFTLNAAFLAPHRLALSRGIRGAVGCLLALNALLLTGSQLFRNLSRHLPTRRR